MPGFLEYPFIFYLGMLETTLFYLLSGLAVLFALGVVFFRSPVYSLLCLVGSMAMTAGLFILLKALFVSIVLILVYAGAILVLFLFVVMLVDFRKDAEPLKLFEVSPVLAALISGAVLAELMWVIKRVGPATLLPVYGTARELGKLIFSNYLLPFELTSFLLLAAITSVVVLAKKEKSS